MARVLVPRIVACVAWMATSVMTLSIFRAVVGGSKGNSGGGIGRWFERVGCGNEDAGKSFSGFGFGRGPWT